MRYSRRGRNDSTRSSDPWSRRSVGLHNRERGRYGDRRTRSGDDRSTVGADERGDDETFTTYTDEEYGYRLAYPADWSVEAEPPGGASFGVNGTRHAGVAVFVDEGVTTVEEYAEAFMDELRADKHVHAVEPATTRDVRVASGQPGVVIECPYVGETPAETWRLAYLFAVVGGVGYTLGVDWNETEPFGTVATRIIDSFAIENNGQTSQRNNR